MLLVGLCFVLLCINAGQFFLGQLRAGNNNHNIMNENPLKYLGMLILGFITSAFTLLIFGSRFSMLLFNCSPIEKIFFTLAKYNHL